MEQEHHTSGVKSSSYLWDQISLVQMEMDYCCSVVSDSLRPRGLQHARPPVPHHLPESAQVHAHCISDAIQPSHPLTLFSFCPQSFPASGTFPMRWHHIRWSKHWSFSFSINPSNKHSRLISLETGWFDLAVQGTLRSLLQHHSAKVLALWHFAFFTDQLSKSYMTTGKDHSLDLSKWIVKK